MSTMSGSHAATWKAMRAGWLLTLAAALFAGMASAAEPPARLAQAAESPAVTQALAELTRFEALVAAMAPGDKATGRKYQSDLSAIGTRLRTAPSSDPRLAGAVERFNALQKRVVDTANASAGAPAPSAQQPAAARLTSSDQARLNRLGGNIRSLGQRVESATLQSLLDDKEVAGFRTSIANTQAELAGYPGDAPGVAEEVHNLDAVVAKLEARLSDAKAKGAVLGDVDAQLSAIDSRIRDKPVPSAQAFKPDAGPEAAGVLVKTLVSIKVESVADLATLDKFTAAGIKDQRIDRLRHWAGAERQRQADESLRGIIEGIEARIDRGLRTAAFHAATDPSLPDHRANRLLGDGRRAAVRTEFADGAAAIETAAVIDAALGRKDAPDRGAQAKAIGESRAAYEEKYNVALVAVRMPAAGITDEKYLAIARETLANPSYGVASPQRMVINSKQVARREKREAEIRPGTVSTTATIYHWVWDEFQVTTAEPVGSEHHLFVNTLKFFHQGAPTTPTGRWVLADRFKSEPILAENIAK